MRLHYFLFATIIFFFSAVFVQAVTIHVKPSELKMKTQPGLLVTQVITVQNPTPNVSLYEVYADDFSDWLLPEPASFILGGKENQPIIVKVKNSEQGIFATTISVIAKPLSERQFKASAGVKIPVEITITKEREGRNFLATISQNAKNFFQQTNLVFISILVSVIILFLIYARKRREFLIEKEYYASPVFRM